MYNAKQSKTFAVTGQSLIPSKLFGWDMTETFGYKSCTIAIFLAILVAILLYVVINKTTFGYELKARGCNKNAANTRHRRKAQHHPLHDHCRRACRLRRGALLPVRRGAVDSGRLDGAAVWRASTAFRWRCLPRPTRLRQSSGNFHLAHLHRRRLHERLFVPARDCGYHPPASSFTCARSRCCSKTSLSRSSRANTKKAPEPVKTDAKEPDGKEAQ